MDYLQFIFEAINNLLTQNLGFFDAMGQNLFRAFATILVVWFGVKSALSSAGGRQAFHFDNFASLLLTVSFGFAMVNYYSAPIPGVGTSFHNLITDESQFLANKINQTELQTVEERIADFETRMDSPGLADVLGTAIYVVIIILLAAAQAIAIVVTAFGFIATAVCVLVGPVFVPFFIVPKMEWLFWGWFRCFIQYAFYQVIAAAVVYIIANLILGIMDLQPKGAISTVQLIEAFPVLFITFFASIYALLKIPALTNHIFSGTAGGCSAGLVGGFVGGLLP
jgi:hypothetical protein